MHGIKIFLQDFALKMQGVAYARDKNISARLCTKNAGGGLCTRGGVFVV